MNSDFEGELTGDRLEELYLNSFVAYSLLSLCSKEQAFSFLYLDLIFKLFNPWFILPEVKIERDELKTQLIRCESQNQAIKITELQNKYNQRRIVYTWCQMALDYYRQLSSFDKNDPLAVNYNLNKINLNKV